MNGKTGEPCKSRYFVTLFNVYCRTRSFSGTYKKPTVRNGVVYSRLLSVFVVTVSVRRSGLSCRNVSADATGQHI